MLFLVLHQLGIHDNMKENKGRELGACQGRWGSGTRRAKDGVGTFNSISSVRLATLGAVPGHGMGKEWGTYAEEQGRNKEGTAAQRQ